MIPYDAPMIAMSLRKMPAERLATTQPINFQRWPAQVAIKAEIIRELIANERARRLA